MKKYLITIAMMLTLGGSQVMMAQNPKIDEPQALVDSTAANGIEAFSDTTDTVGTADQTVVSPQHRLGGYSQGNGISLNVDGLHELIDSNLMEMAFVLLVLLIVFVIAPVLILLVVLYFVFKNRKEKMRLAQVAMQNGQPIPDQLLEGSKEADRDTYQTGMRQLFLGAGLMIFLGYSAGHIGFGIGALVFCIGLGKVVIAKTSTNRDNINPLNSARDEQKTDAL